MTDPGPFRPQRLLRNTYLQTILASSRIRAMGKNPMADAGKEIIFKAKNGARLQGYYSPQVKTKAKAIVILIHGWEGSSQSTYILSTGKFLYEKGYAVLRLNLRDHGQTHHLNEGIFYATLLDEVFESVGQAAHLESDVPAFLVGFSMGGNFALRIARKCSSESIDNLLHIAAISPGLNPAASTDAIDNDWLLKRYFLNKWRRSLKKKEQLYSEIYDFSEIWPLKTVMEMTNLMVERYSEFEDTDEYFKNYKLTDKALKNIGVPTTIIISEDDPIIGIEDFHNLRLNDLTELIVHQYGGHNGFITRFPFLSWYEQKLLNVFDKKILTY
jgi:predicted alpha/beta-fold hydrolase